MLFFSSSFPAPRTSHSTCAQLTPSSVHGCSPRCCSPAGFLWADLAATANPPPGVDAALSSSIRAGHAQGGRHLGARRVGCRYGGHGGHGGQWATQAAASPRIIRHANPSAVLNCLRLCPVQVEEAHEALLKVGCGWGGGWDIRETGSAHAATAPLDLRQFRQRAAPTGPPSKRLISSSVHPAAAGAVPGLQAGAVGGHARGAAGHAAVRAERHGLMLRGRLDMCSPRGAVLRGTSRSNEAPAGGSCGLQPGAQQRRCPGPCNVCFP